MLDLRGAAAAPATTAEASSSAAAAAAPAVLPGKAVTSTATTTTSSSFTSGRSYDSAASAKKLPYSQTQITETVSQRVAKLSAEDFSDDFERLSMEAIPRLKRIFDALALEMPVSAGKKASTEERNEAKNRKSTLVYGEISFASYAIAIEKIKNKYGGLQMPGGVFYDLGHGTGKPSLAAALLHDFQSCTGIEILEALHKGALGVLQRWHAAVESGMEGSAAAASSRTRPWAQLRSVHGDIVVEEKLIKARAETEATVNIGKMDVVFANATCFDGALMESLAKAADRMRPGTFFVSTTNVLPSVKWEIVDTFASKGSWGSVTVYIHKRRSKKNALLHRLAHSAAGTSSRTRTSRGSRY